MRILFALLAILFSAILFSGFMGEELIQPPIPVNGQGHSSIELDIESLILKIMGDSIPGATVAVSKHGRLIFNKGFGYAHYKNRTPMQPYHRSFIGSVSKIISALAIMKLTEEYPSFHLDRKVYFDGGVLDDPDITNAIYTSAIAAGRPELVSWYNQMRVKHLLSHTGGYIRSGPNGSLAADYFGVGTYEITPNQYHAYTILNNELKFAPGTKKAYSNHGVGLSSNIIKSVSGIPYGKYVNQKIFQPLGLDIRRHRDSWDNHSAFPHDYNENEGIKTLNWVERPGGLDRVSAAGGWASSARDLVRLLVATDRISNYPDILESSTLDLMEQRPFSDVSGSHAIGWKTNDESSTLNPGLRLVHDGSIGGAGSAFIAKYKSGFSSSEGDDMSDINIAICFNIQRFGYNRLSDLATEIAKIVARRAIPSSYDLFNDISFRIVDLEGYYDDDKFKYAGIFEPGNYPPAAYFHHSWDRFLEKWRELEGQGYRMKDYESYKVGNRQMYAGIFEPGNYPPAAYFHHSWDRFLEKWRELEGQGYRMKDYESYKVGNRQMYAGIFEPSNYPPAAYFHHSWDRFLEKWRELEGQGYRMKDYESYKVGNRQMYAGIFEPGNHPPAAYFHSDWEQFYDKWRKLECWLCR